MNVPPWLLVALGGALGAVARHGVNVLAARALSAGPWAGFPLATLLVNVTGTFLLSCLATLGAYGLVPPAWRLTLASGFLGAFTTFSTFQLDIDALLRDGAYGRLALYLLGNLGVGYLGLLLGRALALRLPQLF